MIGPAGPASYQTAPSALALMQEVDAVAETTATPSTPGLYGCSSSRAQLPYGGALRHAVWVRRLLLAAAACLALAVPAAAVGIDPASLVLSRADVPAGFRLDREGSGVRSNSTEARNDRKLGALLRRWGRVTGYEAEFDRADATVSSRVDLFTSARGARKLLEYFEREVAKSGIRGLERTRIGLGAGGWVYGGGSSAAFVLVAWRDGRVFAGVAATGVSRKQTLALARVQQRRIASALR